MRRDDDEFAGRDLELVYIAKKLNEAKKLEIVLTEAGFDFAVETDTYSGGFLFRSQRIGAFFYVEPREATRVRELLLVRRYKPHYAAPKSE